MEQELGTVKSQLQLSETRILSKDSLISKYKLQIGNYENLVSNFKRTEDNYVSVVDIQRKQIILRDKIIRRKSFSKWITAILGIGIGIIIAK
jgi:hypothetical protein